MEFKPRAPREGINVSKTHPLTEASTLLVGFGVLIIALVVIAAWSVDLAVGFIPPEAEAGMFESLGLEHPVVQEALSASSPRREDVQRVLDKVAGHWPEAPYKFQAFVWESEDPNAAALPGGYILVTSALLDDVESENELAFVLGHELGHFHNRDHLRRLGRGAVYGLAVSVLLGRAGSTLDLGQLTGELTSKTFDRQQERDADRFGLSLVHAQYGHIGSSWQFFRRLADESSEIDGLAAYLSTHPASESRIGTLRELADEQGWPIEGPVQPF